MNEEWKFEPDPITRSYIDNLDKSPIKYDTLNYHNCVMKMEIIGEVQELCREKGVELLYIFFTGSRAYGYNKEDSQLPRP